MERKRRKRRRRGDEYPYPEEYIPGITAGPLPDDHRTHLTEYLVLSSRDGAVLLGPTPILWDVYEYIPRVGSPGGGGGVFIAEKSQKWGVRKIYRWHRGRGKWLKIV